MNRHVTRSLAVISLLLSVLAQAQETLITDSGREVRINPDGSWSYISEDRFATNAAGQRIRLKPDGSWEPVAPGTELPAANGHHAQVQIPVTLGIARVVIETARSRSSVSSKNVNVQSQTLFTLTASVPDSAAEPFALHLDADALSVEDSSGEVYPVLRVVPAALEIPPGHSTQLQVQADGMPLWTFGKSYQISIRGDRIGRDRDLVLSIPLSAARKQQVDTLSTP